jgi:hypothetical protein
LASKRIEIVGAPALSAAGVGSPRPRSRPGWCRRTGHLAEQPVQRHRGKAEAEHCRGDRERDEADARFFSLECQAGHQSAPI